ncbi:conidial pigment biosynthesis oxidase Abr1/brown 1, partial [Aureobasidium melanogenum]
LSINWFEERFFVQRNIVKIIKEVVIPEVVQDWWRWVVCTSVINQPGGSVEGISGGGYLSFVEEQHVWVHEIKNGVILACVILGSHQERLSLSRSNSNIFAISSSNDRYSVYTINFNSGLVVAINDPAMSTESSWTDDTDQIQCHQ